VGQEQEQRKVEAIDKLMKGFSRKTYLPSLTYYDKVMSTIEGFKIFKAEMRTRLELMQDDQEKV
jgi:hypothetical protein